MQLSFRCSKKQFAKLALLPHPIPLQQTGEGEFEKNLYFFRRAQITLIVFIKHRKLSCVQYPNKLLIKLAYAICCLTIVRRWAFIIVTKSSTALSKLSLITR